MSFFLKRFSTARTAIILFSIFTIVYAGAIVSPKPPSSNNHVDKPKKHPSGPELELDTPSEGASKVEIAVITDPKKKWAQFDQPEAWEKISIPIGKFVVFSKTAHLKHLANNVILATAIPGGFTCATFTSQHCDNKRSSGKDDFHCASNLQSSGNIMRWGVRTKPQCILCLRTDDSSIKVMKNGKYDRFAVELCEPHEDMVKTRKSSLNRGLSDEI